MADEVLFTIVMIVLAVLLFGSVFLYRSRRKTGIESSGGESSFGFKDCYDVCVNDPKREPSHTCNTTCLSYGGA